MTGTTNRIPFEEAADLLPSARACVAFVVDGRPRVEPVTVRYEDTRFLVGFDDRSHPRPEVPEMALVVDDGVLFFDLRAISVRGRPSVVDDASDDGRAWFEIEPTKVTCWDYGRLRVTDGHD